MEMFDIGAPELLIVLIIVALLFGPGRLARTMSEIGKGIRAFRDSVSSDETPDSPTETEATSKKSG